MCGADLGKIQKYHVCRAVPPTAAFDFVGFKGTGSGQGMRVYSSSSRNGSRIYLSPAARRPEACPDISLAKRLLAEANRSTFVSCLAPQCGH
jgi:hypothetical protein